MRSLQALLFSLMLIPSASEAKHIAGGELSYVYLGAGTGGAFRYAFTLRLYRDCGAPPDAAPLDAQARILIQQKGSGLPFANLSVPLLKVERSELLRPDPCFFNRPSVCYDVGIYTFTIELPLTAQGYEVSYQQCCRINGIANVINSGVAGANYVAAVPGQLDHPSGPSNNSPVFNGGDTVLICQNSPFTYDFSARDSDGDSLVYEFAEAYGNSAPGSPYISLDYAPAYTYDRPMGPGVAIDRKSGIMSGRAPTAGIYVVTVQVIEYRDGKRVNRHRKDLHIKVADCSSTAVNLEPKYLNCQGFTLTFQNNGGNPLVRTYSWDFGVPGVMNDTSALERPTFHFPDTGVYKVRLITNRNQLCSDTGYTYASVFPGFKAGFTVDDGCRDVPLLFTDTTRARYGKVVSWNWDFGHPLSSPAISPLQNPFYTYPANGVYDVRLIVGSDKGCRDTVDRRVNVLGKPGLKVTPDQSICLNDTILLYAKGTGTVAWSPSTGLSDPTVSQPLAYPTVRTRYRVTLTNGPGCSNIDSVEIDVVQNPSADAGRDTSILLGQSFRLKGSGGVKYSWSPSDGLSDPNAADPWVRIEKDRTYVLKAFNGAGCFGFDTVNVRVFKTGPEIFVPTAFTPNGDALNDILKAIPVGIREFLFFRVYNRWGRLVFGTTDAGKGWDGRIEGKPQAAQTFVWHAAGVSFDDRPIQRSGTVTLIR